MMEDDEKSGSDVQQSVAQFAKNSYKVLSQAIQASSKLPDEYEWNFHCTYEKFSEVIERNHSCISRMLSTLAVGPQSHKSEKNDEILIDINDTLLERIANNLDDLAGVKRTGIEPIVLQTVSTSHIPTNAWHNTKNATFYNNGVLQQANNNDVVENHRPIRLLTAKNIIRPQKFFKDTIDNRNSVPWQPRLHTKPNSLKPLAIYLEEINGHEEFCQPYEWELDAFKPSAQHCVTITEEEYNDSGEIPSLDRIPLVEITQDNQLEALVETLRHCTEFAVDLEHHSYRSFMGFTCLMQISTRSTDYLIDTLVLRDKLWYLNEVFTKSSIVKIFHGADLDIEWLQRDLSIYVVNLFDTHQAAKLLQYPALSLAYLLKHHCHVNANKQFQLADWRIRPLPDELKTYARTDTRYLIRIYERLKRELAVKCESLVQLAFGNSTELCRKRYCKPLRTERTYLDLYRRSKKLFNNRQLSGLRELYTWRDECARAEDESLGYVMPNHMLLHIAETLPREMQGILACCNPIPPLVRSNLLQLHQIVLHAREQPLEQPVETTTTSRRNQSIVHNHLLKANLDDALYCPHDLTRSEYCEVLPTLLLPGDTHRQVEVTENQLEKNTVTYSIFNSKTMFMRDAPVSTNVFTHFWSPYQRYHSSRSIKDDEKITENVKEEDKSVKDMSKTQQEPKKPPSSDSHYDDDIQFVSDTRVGSCDQMLNEKSLVHSGGSRKRHVNTFTQNETPDTKKRRKRKRKRNNSNLKLLPTSTTVEQPSLTMKNQPTRPKLPKMGTWPPRQQQFIGGITTSPPVRNQFKPFDYQQVNFANFSSAIRPIKQNFVQRKSRSKGRRKCHQ